MGQVRRPKEETAWQREWDRARRKCDSEEGALGVSEELEHFGKRIYTDWEIYTVLKHINISSKLESAVKKIISTRTVDNILNT
jgi:hypothetical protein